MPLFRFVTLCLHYVTFKSFLVQLFAQYAPLFFFSQTQRSKDFCDVGRRGRLSVSRGLPLCNYHFNEVAPTVRQDHTSHYAAVFFSLFTPSCRQPALPFLSTSLVLVLAGRPALQADVSRIKTGRGGGGGGGGGRGGEGKLGSYVYFHK